MIELKPVSFTAHAIRVGLAERIDAKLVKMNKKLAKLGAPPATVEFGPRVTITEKDEITGFEWSYDEFETVTVNGFEASHAGWTPIASLDHTLADDEALVSKFPGAIADEELGTVGIDLPEEFRFRGPKCDHCGINIARNRTIVFGHEDGRFIQVGTTCVLEFFGVDPATVLWLMESVTGMFEDEDEGGSKADQYIDPFTFLAVAAECIRINGFTKSQDWEGTPTKAQANELIFGRLSEKKRNEMFPGFDLDAGKAVAEKVVEWVAADESFTDYMRSASLALRANAVARTTEGILASLPASFHRTFAEKVEKADEIPSVHVGSIGDKITAFGEIITAITIETMYGASRRVTLRTDEGNLFTTFGSGNDLWGLNPGDKVRWTGKVKGHTDDKYGIQTEFKTVKIADLNEDGTLADVVIGKCHECGDTTAVGSPDLTAKQKKALNIPALCGHEHCTTATARRAEIEAKTEARRAEIRAQYEAEKAEDLAAVTA